MLLNLFTNPNYQVFALLGIIIAYISTCLLLKTCGKLLPKDGGREFAHDGKLSEGKPRGAGFIFILVFTVISLLFVPNTNNEIIIYLVLTLAAMLTGFFDDCSKSPWGELKKGILDLIIAIMVSATFINYNTTEVTFEIINFSIIINPVIFFILSVILVWVSINVTNCADGVDGLSGTLAIISLVSLYAVGALKSLNVDFNYSILILVVCILGYLWFNATPSKMIMGDAGSRALGLFISIAALKTGNPFLYIPLAFVLILDGGLGLVKVFLLRFLKIKILTKTRTPLHDHVRKNLDWSNTQTVFKFAILQIMICVVTIYVIML